MREINRILVAEDSPTQGALVVADLRDAGFEVTLAANGNDALESLSSRPFDLVLSDIVMPGMDGYELCRRAKEAQPDLPVVLLTSLTDPLEIVRGLEVGADNFLRKPYDPQQLVERLRTMLYHRAMRASGRASVGLEVMLLDKRFLITAERQQILDLLISSFEDLVTSNQQLREREAALVLADERLRVELQAAEEERRRLRTVLEAAPSAMAVVDLQGRITGVSSRLAMLLGRSREELLGRPLVDEVHFVDADGNPVLPMARPMARVLAGAHGCEAGSDFNLFIQRGDGTRGPVIANAAPVVSATGETIGAVGSLHEIGELAGHDPITRLPNQSLFADRLRMAMGTAAGDDVADVADVAVLALRLDTYDRYRERLTPAELDEILTSFARSLESVLATRREGRPFPLAATDSLGYLGNGIFGVLLAGIESELSPALVAQELLEALSAAGLTADAVDLQVTVSVGIAVADAGTDAVEVISGAVAALRTAMAAGAGSTALADAGAQVKLQDWLQQERELRQAIKEGQLVVHYQPEVTLRTGRPFGAEALVRWQHPVRGLLQPAEFLPLADEAALLAPLGWYVLDSACRQAAQWRQTLPGGERLTISVNFDSAQLDDPTMVDRVQDALVRAGLEPEALVVEVTERGVAKNLDTTANRLRQLKRLGVHVAIDDFGTGYSSLLGLRRLPIDALKIDRAFISGMVDEPEDAAIVIATIRLAQALGMAVVAEGVENEEQLIKLRLLGCDAAQGFHWAAPLTLSDFANWWVEHHDDPGPDGSRDELSDDASVRMDQTLAHLLHELRTPLAVVTGYAQLALEHPHEAARFLDPVVRNAEDLNRRLSVLTDAQVVSQGRMELDLEPYEIRALIETMVEDLRVECHPHPIRLVADEAVEARIDRTRFGQVLTNLVSNAAKFSPGDVPIEVHLTGDKRSVAVAVVDHGSGVAPERRSELFRRFARLGSTQKGTGLGLHLARSIARAHGGDIHHEDTPGGGATFRVVLPVDL